MIVITGEEQYTGKGAVLALGMFDGVHLGHRSLINRAVELAREMDADAMVCTFDRHPLSVIKPEAAPEALMSLEERLGIFEELGADWALVKPFTMEFANMEAEKFLEELASLTHARAIVCGENYSFGRGGRGGSAMIEEMAHKLGYRPVIMKSVRIGGEMVSSTLIRRLLSEGETQRARELLGK
jgi:riboflavin kinase/FMN adenylyltransferase